MNKTAAAKTSITRLLTPSFEPIIFLRIAGILSLLINTVGCYLIIYRSHKTFADIKWHFLYLQILGLVADIYFDFLMTPIPLFPLIGGYSTGLLYSLCHVPSKPQFVILCIIWCLQICSIGIIFFHKYQSILPYTSAFKLNSDISLALKVGVNIVFISTVPPVFYLSILDNPTMWKYANQTFDTPSIRLLHHLPSSPVLLVSSLNHWVLICFCVLLLVFGTSIFVLLWCLFGTFRALSQHASIMTKRTYRMRRHSIIMMIVQVLVPFSCYVIPVLTFVLVVYFNIQAPELCNCMICLFSLFASLSTIVQTMTIKSYRNAVLNWLSPISHYLCCSPIQIRSDQTLFISTTTTTFNHGCLPKQNHKTPAHRRSLHTIAQTSTT